MSDCEELSISQRIWERSMDSIEKDGFREGFELGRKKNFQKGFDIGFKTGFELSFKKGFQRAETQMLKSSNNSYQTTGDGCVICSEPNSDEVMKLSLNTIVEKQMQTFELS